MLRVNRPLLGFGWRSGHRRRYGLFMTGLEGAAAGAMVGTGKRVLKNASVEQKAINKALLDDTRKTPEFQRAARLYGERQALRQGISTNIVRLFAKMFRLPSDYLENDLGGDLAGKLDHVPDEDLRPPARNIAGPVFEGLDRAADEPELRDLYLELLARAMDDKYVDAAHPSFVSVIAQLSAPEADLLRLFIGVNEGTLNSPIVELRVKFQPGSTHTVHSTHLLNIRDNDGAPLLDQRIPTFVDNWIRLGLVEVRYDAWLTKDGSYAWVEERPEWLAFKQEVEATTFVPREDAESISAEYQQGVLAPTAFGRSFGVAVGMFGELARPE